MTTTDAGLRAAQPEPTGFITTEPAARQWRVTLPAVQSYVAIIRDLLLIAFLTATIMAAGGIYRAVQDAGTGGSGGEVPVWEQTTPEPMPPAPACIGEEPCTE